MQRLIGALLALTYGLVVRLQRRDERGSVTTEHVLWAVAVIAIVAIVVAAVKAYVTSQAATSSSRRRQDERGSATIELMILLPALFAVMFLGMQAALFYHARFRGQSRLRRGCPAAAGEHGHESDGVQAANAFMKEAGGDDVLPGATTTASRTTTTVTVVVQGHSLSVIPGWSPVVRQEASVPVERLTEP